jgi:hypothetical protein
MLMANEDNSGTNLAGSVIFVALVSAGFYFFSHEAPLVDMRPPEQQHHIEAHASPQKIEARLWQDPFRAVDEFREKSDAQKAEQNCSDDLGIVNSDPCKAPLDPRAKPQMVLGVTVPGGPYLEDSEQRLRTRYAVLAGLKRAGFVPEDRRHIGYFVWTQAPSLVLAPILPESVTRLPLLACQADALPCNHSTMAESASARAESAPPLFCLLHGTTVHVGRTLPHAAFGEPPIVPYEKFKRVQEPDNASSNTPNTAPDSVLVLWLKEEDLLKRGPLTELDELVGLLKQDQHPTVKFIGPSSSDMLHEMVNEAALRREPFCADDQKGADDQGYWTNLEDVEFYAYLASVPDKYLFDKSCTLQNYFEKLRINLERTIATEDAIAKGILNELLLRRINPTPDPQPNNPTSKDEIALISEWDTYYGQTLPKSVEQAFTHDDLDHHPWIHKFTYLRGLNGLLPSTVGKEETKQDKSTTAGEKPGGTRDFFKMEKDTQNLERPIGESQYDYLRRISGRLHKIDDELRKKTDQEGNEKRIKAIGILGGDVFDKLLILRALRPEFPEALFFANDFDEAFTVKSELPFTRNLIISSSFGPNLSEWLQGDIPPFRDIGETSAFLATQLAIGRLPQDLETQSAFPHDLSTQLSAPRLFEITRTGGIIPFAWRERSLLLTSCPLLNRKTTSGHTRIVRKLPIPIPSQDVLYQPALWAVTGLFATPSSL